VSECSDAATYTATVAKETKTKTKEGHNIPTVPLITTPLIENQLKERTSLRTGLIAPD
jgi:hypothetical protein